MNDSIIFISAYLLDLLIGDPRWMPHPVRMIGKCISFTEQVLCRNNKEDKTQDTGNREKIMGVLLIIIIVCGTYTVSYVIDSLLHEALKPLNLYSYLSFILLVYLTSSTLATRELLRAGRGIIVAVEDDDTDTARKRLSHIVGRDTKRLEKKDILRAAIESIAENTSDGIIAPMFYYAIGGLPLAMTYKAINTLDSMVGYRNERYRDFGWASARLDDIANYIPARVTGMLIVISTFVLTLFKNTLYPLLSTSCSFKTVLRDGRKHESPNSGFPEAAMAGALGVRLGGPSTYGGIPVKRPFIGDELSDSLGFYMDSTRGAMVVTSITSFIGMLGTVVILHEGVLL